MDHTLGIDRCVCVGFLYTLMVRRPSGSLETAVSRKANFLSFSVSMVKRMEGCWLLRCYKKSSTCSRSRMVKVSSTQRFQILGSSDDAVIACNTVSYLPPLFK